MSVNPVGEVEGTALDVPVGRDSAERLCLIRVWRIIWIPAKRGPSKGVNRRKSAAALTLVEAIVTIVVLLIAVLGAMGFRYYCTLDARKADLQVTAGRLGLLLLESWKSMGGLSASDPDNNYDPENLAVNPELQIFSGSGPSTPVEFTSFGSYEIVDAGGAHYYARLSYKDEIADELRILNVQVVWQRGDDTGVGQVVRLTTYVNY